MRLRQIRLAGFKSFVDPTPIDVPGTLIGVVGPNGCGKSNLLEAIRWVMGELSARHLLPYLPGEFARVPRANVRFLAIENAWFSGSMNYLGHARGPDGSPEYEASYELNAALEISVPEFQQLVSHEVVPGHVTTFAYLQDLYVRGLAGFEASVLTMNTRASVLFEGIANNAILIAHGVTEPVDLPDRDLELGVLLALVTRTRRTSSPNRRTWTATMPCCAGTTTSCWPGANRCRSPAPPAPMPNACGWR